MLGERRIRDGFPEYQRSEEETELVERAVRSESVVYEFATCDLAQHHFAPPVLSRLANLGVIDTHTKLKLLMAFQEGLSNAIEHGNLELQSAWKEEFDAEGNDMFKATKKQRLADPAYGGRIVCIESELKSGMLRITIKDQGKGFANAGLRPKYRELAPSETLHGRGLMLMNGALDEVHHNSVGNELTLIKYL